MAMMTLDSFTQKLMSGGYSQRGFASRAVNKSKDLSEADKKKALAAVDNYFGGAAPAPKAKKAPTKKASAKKAPAAKKAAPKKATPKARPAAATVAANVAAPAVAEQPSTIEERLATYGKAIDHYATAAKTLREISTDKVSVEEGLKSASTGLTALVKSMHQNIVEPIIGAGVPAAAHLNGSSNGVPRVHA